MSKDLKESQLIAAELLSVGISSTIVSEKLGIRPETLSRWRQNQEFNDEIEQKVNKNCSLIEKQFLRLFYLSLNTLETVLTDNKVKPIAKANIAVKYISHFGIDDSVKKQVFTNQKENHTGKSEAFDLIQQLYQKGKKDGKEELDREQNLENS